jgi:hypothetical protein
MTVNQYMVVVSIDHGDSIFAILQCCVKLSDCCTRCCKKSERFNEIFNDCACLNFFGGGRQKNEIIK